MVALPIGARRLSKCFENATECWLLLCRAVPCVTFEAPISIEYPLLLSILVAVSLSDMKSNPLFLLPFLVVTTALSIEAPFGFISQPGDQSIILHWDRNAEPNVGSYRVYHSLSNAGPFVLLSSTDGIAPGFCDLNVTNGQTNFYYVTAVTTSSQESPPSATLAATSHPFANDDEFLDYVQQACFDYFWYAANPTNGMVPDRSAKGSPCSIAAVGFGLTAIGIAIDHGWITRTQGVTRVRNTLNSFLNLPHGTNSSGTTGYKGWFYHFLDMNRGLRYAASNS